MTDEFAHFREVAVTAAHMAGTVLTGFLGHANPREKAPSDLVTDADLASQKAIVAILLDAFPDHTILAEEAGLVPDSTKHFRWIVDPLDGTINFAHGVPFWCVSIALEVHGQLVVGVVHHPMFNQTFSGSLGAGATLNGQAIRVSTSAQLSSCLIATGMPTDFARSARRQLAYFERFSVGTHSVRRTGMSAWNLAMVAAGGFDVYYATAIHPWDAAAGVVLVREAGGSVTGLHSEPYNLYGAGILASNGQVHDEALQAVAEAWPHHSN